MTTNESKGRFFYKTNLFESIRITNRIESIRIANWNALVPAVCSPHTDNLRQQEFCRQWTSRVEQFTCGTAIK